MGRAGRQLPAEKDAVRVRVVGQQFAWNIHYPGPDGVFGKTDIKLVDAQANPLGIDKKDPAAADDFTTVNQLHLPVNKPAIVYLSSMDVIHSFGLQEMRVKQDAIPGLVTPVWFEPTVVQRRHAEAQGRRQVELRDLVRAALRPRPLPHARLRHDRHGGSVRRVDGGAGEGRQGVRVGRRVELTATG